MPKESTNHFQHYLAGRLFLTLIGMYILIVQGCKEPPEIPLLEVDDDFLEYCWFPADSYWIYREQSDSTLVDTVRIGFHDSAIIPADRSVEFNYERFVFDYEVRNINYRVNIYPKNKPGNPNLLVYEEFAINGSIPAYHFFQSEEYGDTANLDFTDTYIAFRRDTMSIGGTLYSDLIKVEHEASAYGNPTKSVVFTRNVGIVQREFWDGSVWDLVKYKIK
jgi:hypothetical protein